MDAIVAELSRTFEAEDATRVKLGTLRDAADDAVRAAQRQVGALHTHPDLKTCTEHAAASLPRVGEALVALETALPTEDGGAYYRYNDMWRRTLQNAVCVCVVLRFAENDSLADPAAVRLMLDASTLSLPLEDYLVGVISSVSELARLCMNRVTLSDFNTPQRCALFANCVFEGFKELNFRNDFLRKRYDGMKYDVKRIEEIMYDLSIRGLLKRDNAEDAGAGNHMAVDADAVGGTAAEAAVKIVDGELRAVSKE